MSDFESTFLTPVRFWIEKFTMNQTLKKTFLWKLKKLWKNLLWKNQFLWVILQRENDKGGTFVLSRKSWFWWNFVRKSTFFQSNFSSSFPFWLKVSKKCENLDKVFKHVNFWANILKLVKTLIESLGTCQIIKFIGEISVQKINFWVVLKR